MLGTMYKQQINEANERRKNTLDADRAEEQ
jgi:hypothetical protein